MEASHFSNLQHASSRLAFRETYMRRFLPLLSCVRERSAMKRYKAVKTAADLSLAFTVGKTRWSKALCRRLSAQRNSFCSIANEAGLKRLRRRRIWVRATQSLPLNYRKSYLQAQRKHLKSKQQATHYGKLKLEETQVARRPNVINTQYGNLEASKLSSLSELIPGGLHMDIPKLLDQAAHYIVSLKLQVDALSFLGQTLSTSKHL